MDTAALIYMQLRPKEVILLMLKIATNLIGVSFLIPSGSWLCPPAGPHFLLSSYTYFPMTKHLREPFIVPLGSLSFICCRYRMS